MWGCMISLLFTATIVGLALMFFIAFLVLLL
jgi:hypothetical protein